MWVIDFEASGLSKKSYPIEVGLTNGNIEYQSLITPMNHWTYWDQEAERIHNITQAALNAFGTASKEVALKLNELLSGQTVYCDCKEWDDFWCNVLFSDNAISPKFKIEDISNLLINEQELANYLTKKQELEDSGEFRLHRALDDAKILYQSLLDSSPL